MARSLGGSVGPGGGCGVDGVCVGRGRRVWSQGVLLVCTMGHRRVVDSTVLRDSNVCWVCAGMQRATVPAGSAHGGSSGAGAWPGQYRPLAIAAWYHPIMLVRWY